MRGGPPFSFPQSDSFQTSLFKELIDFPRVQESWRGRRNVRQCAVGPWEDPRNEVIESRKFSRLVTIFSKYLSMRVASISLNPV